MRNNIVSGKTNYYSTVKSDRYKLIRSGKIGSQSIFLTIKNQMILKK